MRGKGCSARWFYEIVIFPSDYLGLTDYTNYDYIGTHTYQGVTKYHFELYGVTGCVVSRSDVTYNNYIKTASHELGHALGWYGHPASVQSTWVMEQGMLENTVLSTEEKQHLAQVY